MRKFWAGTLPLVLLAGGLIATPQAISATPAAAAPVTTLSPASPITMERFDYYSAQPTRFIRPVVLQKKVGSSWRTIFSGHTGANGKFRFTVHTGSVDTLRSYSVAYRYKGRTYPAAATAAITVRPVTQTVSLEMASTTTTGTSLSATAVTTPARAGRGVSLQILKNSTWTTLASGKVGANGRGTFRPKALAIGTYSYRVVAAGWNGASIMTSTPVTIVVKSELVPNGAVASLTAPNMYGDFYRGQYPDNGWYGSGGEGTGNWAQPDGVHLYTDGSGALHTVTPSSNSLTITTVDTRTYKTTSTKVISMPNYPIWGGLLRRARWELLHPFREGEPERAGLVAGSRDSKVRLVLATGWNWISEGRGIPWPERYLLTVCIRQRFDGTQWLHPARRHASPDVQHLRSPPSVEPHFRAEHHHDERQDLR